MKMHIAQEDWSAASSQCEEMLAAQPDHVMAAFWGTLAYARGGHAERARELAAPLLRNREVPAGPRARLRQELGR